MQNESNFLGRGWVCCQANHTTQHETTVAKNLDDPHYLDHLIPKSPIPSFRPPPPDKPLKMPPTQRALFESVVTETPKVTTTQLAGARGRAQKNRRAVTPPPKPRSEPTKVPSSSTSPNVRFDVPRRAYFRNSTSFDVSSATWDLDEDRKNLQRKINRDPELSRLKEELDDALSAEGRRNDNKLRKDVLRPKNSRGVAVCVGGRYHIGKKLGSGSFGVIYLGKNLLTGTDVAVKMEHIRRRNPHLIYECKIYGLLQGVPGVPKLYWYGVEGEYCVMVIDLLGPSLEDLFSYCGRKFRLKTGLMLAYQMIERIGDVQKLGIIHRDIKPHNFLMGNSTKENRVYIIDFGLAKKFMDAGGVHIPYVEGKSLTGTARYVSINTHIGIEQSRRDDFESLGYVFVYFVKGSLPWQGLRAQSKKEKYEKIMNKKIDVSIKDLCRGLPKGFEDYFNYIRGVRFTEEPDVQMMKDLIRSMMADHSHKFDQKWDWTAGHDDDDAVRK